MIKTLSALIIAATFATAAYAAPAKVIKLVTIDGSTFKVRIRGDRAEVARQAVVINANADHWIKAKEAAEIATGCKAADTFTVVDLLMVRLDCSIKPTGLPDATVRDH